MAVWGTCYQIGSALAKGLAAFLFGWLGLAWAFSGSSLVLLALLGLTACSRSWEHESAIAKSSSSSERATTASSPSEPTKTMDGAVSFPRYCALCHAATRSAFCVMPPRRR